MAVDEKADCAAILFFALKGAKSVPGAIRAAPPHDDLSGESDSCAWAPLERLENG
jgi:hypothetical protein